MNKTAMKRELIGALASVAGMLVLTLGAIVARQQGYIDRETVTRVVFIPIGLWMAWNGNRIPKNVVPHARAGQAQRVAAWSLVLSGLVYAGLFAFAPMPVAMWGGSAAVLTGVAVTFGYCLSLRDKAKAG
jgi:hypothetical protein